jgi:hypothetical protein
MKLIHYYFQIALIVIDVSTPLSSAIASEFFFAIVKTLD